MKINALIFSTIALLGCAETSQPRSRQTWTTWWGISTLYVSAQGGGAVTIDPRSTDPSCEALATPDEADLIAQEIEDHQSSAVDTTFALESGDSVRIESVVLLGEWSTSMTSTAAGAKGKQYFCRMHLYPQSAWLDVAVDLHDAADYAAASLF